MHIDIVTLDKIIFSGEVWSVTVPGSKGMFQILKNHAPIISTLEKGIIKLIADKDKIKKISKGDIETYNEENGSFILKINKGVVDVNNNKITVLLN
ncbi:F0F1 ATP synthase subunit epsilon [Ichthyobacterium seriolicida]|uniref:ATP synthase epsilon chain n=1 Tax=Ichthyobacterium seriolicida TaxID=242600 RepID=A0A1J1DYL7_9FLAO|nr:F0F1 ATP synthase subunit epsilon [Ichthyobacterium seriolicida]BAV94977.1 ATP synthase epsilon chain [Ichthyobacterium seriolicida]